MLVWRLQCEAQDGFRNVPGIGHDPVVLVTMVVPTPVNLFVICDFVVFRWESPNQITATVLVI